MRVFRSDLFNKEMEVNFLKAMLGILLALVV